MKKEIIATSACYFEFLCELIFEIFSELMTFFKSLISVNIFLLSKMVLLALYSLELTEIKQI